MARNRKVIRYRRPFHLNIGVIIFAAIFVYLAFSLYAYAKRDKVQFYEVSEGSIVNDKTYTGIIFRQESVQQTQSTGYVNYFIREGKRASRGSRIYSLDETGELGKFLEENRAQGSDLSSENLSELKKQLSAFSLSYYDADFGSVYSAQYALQSSVAEYMNINAMDSLDAALQEHGINYQQITTGEAGVVSYAVDGYEGIDSTTVTPELFDRTKYSRKSIKSGELTEAGTPVYKLISSEDWSVVFPLDEESEQNFADRRSLTIKPAASDLKLVGRYSTFAGTDGTKYGKLDFDKYMIEYCADRFMDFEVISDEARGLKIPVTSIVEREFFTIPVAYLTGGGDANPGENGFLKEVYGGDGESSVEFTPVEIFNQDENYVYVEKVEEGAIKSGDYLVMPDSTERYQVGATETRAGAYNINKGYAVFKYIEELASNGEYVIVKKDTRYGLSVYDHIVLDASTIQDGQLIYQ